MTYIASQQIRAGNLRVGDYLYGRKVTEILYKIQVRGELKVRFEDGQTGIAWFHTPAERRKDT